MATKTVTVNGKDVTFTKFNIRPNGKDTGTVSTEYVIKDSAGSSSSSSPSLAPTGSPPSLAPTGSPATISVTIDNLTLNKGETKDLTVTINPTGAFIDSFISSDPKIATVTKGGKVTGVEKGDVDITGKTHDGKEAKCKVTVTDSAPISVTGINTTTPTLNIEVGNTGQFTINVEPATATDKSVTYVSDTPGVATVDSAGVVTGVSPGTAKITATTNDGSKTVDCNVTVTVVIDIGLTAPTATNTYYLPFIDTDVISHSKPQTILGKIEDITFTSVDNPDYAVYQLSPVIKNKGNDYSFGLLPKNPGNFKLDILRAGNKIGEYNVTVPATGGNRSTHKNRKFRYTRKASSRKTRKH
jgi:uncharacterized protein YjdB